MEIFLRFLGGLVFGAGGGACIYAGTQQPSGSGSAIGLYVIGGILLLITLAFWGLLGAFFEGFDLGDIF